VEPRHSSLFSKSPLCRLHIGYALSARLSFVNIRCSGVEITCMNAKSNCIIHNVQSEVAEKAKMHERGV
jgi:hypothetical protein